MKTTVVRFQQETIEALEHLYKTCPNTVAAQEMKLGEQQAEPILIIFDSLIRYAKSYATRFGDKVETDYMLCNEFGAMLAGARAMLNFNGAVANEKDGYSRDSKDNSVMETLYWKACEIAGIDGDSL